MSCQLGILDRPQDHATVLTFDVADAGSVQKSLTKLWEDLAERLHDWHRGQNLTVTIGFGLPIFDKLGQLDRMPKALKLMPGWEGDARVPVVLIGDEDEPNRDGSYLVLREIREDLDRWEQLSVDAQERVAGRRKADSAKFDPEESTPLDSHRLKSGVETEEGEIEILRRSFPFSGPNAAGLAFIMLRARPLPA